MSIDTIHCTGLLSNLPVFAFSRHLVWELKFDKFHTSYPLNCGILSSRRELLLPCQDLHGLAESLQFPRSYSTQGPRWLRTTWGRHLRSSATHFPAIWFKFKQKIMQKIKLILVFASNFGKSQSLNYFCIIMTCSFFFLRIFLILASFVFLCVAEDLKCRPQVVRNHRGPCVLYDRGNCKDSARDGIRQIWATQKTLIRRL